MSALNMRDGESSNFSSATQPLNPNNPYSPDGKFFEIRIFLINNILLSGRKSKSWSKF